MKLIHNVNDIIISYKINISYSILSLSYYLSFLLNKLEIKDFFLIIYILHASLSHSLFYYITLGF